VSSLRSENVHLHPLTLDRAARVKLLDQQPSVLWFTGLSGSGKSTIANLVEVELHARGHATSLLDGDNVRHGLCGDLGFSDADRCENLRRVAEVARLMLESGLIVLVSFISPFRAERQRIRESFAPEEFFEVHVDTPISVAEQRDPKGLYVRARRGEITHFTGIDSPYEPPESPEIRLDTAAASPTSAAAEIIAALTEAGRLSANATTRGTEDCPLECRLLSGHD
jgi:bifunctional enzyme CysN/CysC